MAPISQRFQIPRDADNFEELCRDLLRVHWGRAGLEIFGKRGERQFGIDILDLGGETPIYAAQCKLKEEHKSLAPKEIEDEVDDAKNFIPPLGKYGILTTGKVSTDAQRKVREINQSHRKLKLFEVELLTWEKICSLLQRHPEVQEFFYEQLPSTRGSRMETQLVAIGEGLQLLTSKAEGDGIDSEINQARECIVSKQFQAATFLLNRLDRANSGQLTQRQRFRIQSNLGAAALGNGELESAAKYFLAALPLQPDDEKGRTNEALAYLLVGDPNTCFQKTDVLCKEFPGSSRLAALRIASAPKGVSLADLVAQTSSVLRSDAEVCVGLARRAMAEYAFDEASAYADTAVKSAPNWSQAQLTIGHIALGRVLHKQLGFKPIGSISESSLSMAEEACSRALELARAEGDKQIERMALILRTDVRLMLKKTNEAASDAAEAQRLEPKDPQVQVNIAQCLLAEGKIDEAIANLKKVLSTHPDPNIAFMYAQAVRTRGTESDLREAIGTLTEISLGEVYRTVRPTIASVAMQLMVERKAWDAAEKYLIEISPSVEPEFLAISKGYLAHYRGNPREAEAFAEQAYLAANKSDNPHTKDYLAQLLSLVGRLSDALPIYKELLDTKAPSFHPGTLLNCAARLRRDDVILDTCAEMHARGINDWQLIKFELPYLERYDIETAIARLQEFISENPDHKLAKLRLSIIGLMLDRGELVRATREDLPPVAQLPVEYAVFAAQILKYGGKPNESVEYSYEFLRANFGRMEAHQALIVSMIPGTFAPSIPAVLDVISAGSAVCYREVPAGADTWVVLEHTIEPNRDFEELPLSSPLAGQLLGRKVGDTVVIAKGSMQDRQATIVRIVPKYVRRYQDSMGEMQVRFGTESPVESVRVGEENQQPNLDIILASVERQATATASIREAYKTLPTSLHWYGSRFGKNAYSGLMDLAAEPGESVKCCFGTPAERHEALAALLSAKAVVLDITALATLRLLGLEKVLSTTRFRFVTAQQTWLEYQQMLFNSFVSSADGGTLVFREGKHILIENSAEQKAIRNQQDKEFLRFVESVVARRSVPALAALQPEKRRSLEKFFGDYGADSIVLGSEPEHVLWTDDLVQAQTAAQEFGCRRVWTQVVLAALTDDGLVSFEDYTNASARLLGMNFLATSYDSASMIAAFRLANWSVDASPASQVIAIFAEPNFSTQNLLKVFIEFLVRLYSEPLSQEIRCAATQAFLNVFAARPDALVSISGIRKMSARIFGLNAIGNAQFDACFDRWAQSRDRPIILRV